MAFSICVASSRMHKTHGALTSTNLWWGLSYWFQMRNNAEALKKKGRVQRLLPVLITAIDRYKRLL